MMTDQEKIAVVQTMLAAWNRLDFAAIENLFTDDGVLHSVMLEPKVGRETIAKHLKTLGSAKPGSKVDIQVIHIGVIDGVVFTERLDKLEIEGRKGEVPVIGTFVIRDGKVAHWREFYDRTSMLRITRPEALV